ncbi:MAG: hypothetical protein KAI61_06570 [Alphaproteobacteria bacterium]|nr:hypothetical protein [Alphaproteobacteria bacterium]
MPKHAVVESGTSYLIAGGVPLAASLADIASTAQSIAIILGCGVVFLRLIYDGFKLYRYLKEKR